MKVVFYIGHHKVGSTALQTYLAQNWLRLAQAGILYPSVETRGFSSNLERALGAGDSAGVDDVNIREPHSALAYKMMSEVSEHRRVPPQFKRLPGSGQMLAAIQNQVRRLKPDTLILCSEAFANFGQVKPALIKTLCTAFPGASFEIYCALRRPDDYLISWHGQRLKVGEKLEPLSHGGAAGYFDNIHFNFRTVIEPWIERVPNARLILRPYDEIIAAGGSTEDFTRQLSCTFPEGMIPAGRANTSLPRAAMEIARCANHELPPPQAHALVQYLLAGKGLDPVKNRDVELFGAPVRTEMADRFGPIHDYLSGLRDGAPFFADYDDLTRTAPVSEGSAALDLLRQIRTERIAGAEGTAIADFLAQHEARLSAPSSAGPSLKARTDG